MNRNNDNNKLEKKPLHKSQQTLEIVRLKSRQNLKVEMFALALVRTISSAIKKKGFLRVEMGSNNVRLGQVTMEKFVLSKLKRTPSFTIFNYILRFQRYVGSPSFQGGRLFGFLL